MADDHKTRIPLDKFKIGQEFILHADDVSVLNDTDSTILTNHNLTTKWPRKSILSKYEEEEDEIYSINNQPRWEMKDENLVSLEVSKAF